VEEVYHFLNDKEFLPVTLQLPKRKLKYCAHLTFHILLLRDPPTRSDFCLEFNIFARILILLVLLTIFALESTKKISRKIDFKKLLHGVK